MRFGEVWGDAGRSYYLLLTMAILTTAHVVGEDAHDAYLLVAVREGRPALDVGQLDAELHSE